MIVALGYKKFSGKDSVANRLVDKWGFKKVHLADPIKIACKELFRLSDEQLYGNLKEVIDPRWNKTPRQLFQLLTEECCRTIIDPLILEKSLSFKFDLQKDNVVIADLRKKESANYIKSIGGQVWKIDRELNYYDNHISETSMDDYQDWDYVINNNKSLAELYKSVDSIINNISGETNVYHRRKA